MKSTFDIQPIRHILSTACDGNEEEMLECTANICYMFLKMPNLHRYIERIHKCLEEHGISFEDFRNIFTDKNAYESLKSSMANVQVSRLSLSQEYNNLEMFIGSLVRRLYNQSKYIVGWGSDIFTFEGIVHNGKFQMPKNVYLDGVKVEYSFSFSGYLNFPSGWGIESCEVDSAPVSWDMMLVHGSTVDEAIKYISSQMLTVILQYAAHEAKDPLHREDVLQKLFKKMGWYNNYIDIKMFLMRSLQTIRSFDKGLVKCIENLVDRESFESYNEGDKCYVWVNGIPLQEENSVLVWDGNRWCEQKDNSFVERARLYFNMAN